jgi:hypothetical protein
VSNDSIEEIRVNVVRLPHCSKGFVTQFYFFPLHQARAPAVPIAPVFTRCRRRGSRRKCKSGVGVVTGNLLKSLLSSVFLRSGRNLFPHQRAANRAIERILLFCWIPGNPYLVNCSALLTDLIFAPLGTPSSDHIYTSVSFMNLRGRIAGSGKQGRLMYFKALTLPFRYLVFFA